MQIVKKIMRKTKYRISRYFERPCVLHDDDDACHRMMMVLVRMMTYPGVDDRDSLNSVFL